MSTGDPIIDALIEQGGSGMLPESDVYGGFHNFQPTNPNLGGPGQNAPVGGRRSPSESDAAVPGRNAPYTTAYVQDMWRGLPLEHKVRLQDALVALGLARNAIPGEFDKDTRNGVETLLTLSNAAGTTWQATIGRLQQLKDAGQLDPSGGEFTEPAYLPPDYASLAQTVKQTVRSTLGRDPSDDEIAELSAQLQGFDYSAFQAEVDAERAQFETQQAGGGTVPQTGRQVDTASRFRELIESKYGDELAFNQRREEGAENRQLTLGAVGTIDRIIQGF